MRLIFVLITTAESQPSVVRCAYVGVADALLVFHGVLGTPWRKGARCVGIFDARGRPDMFVIVERIGMMQLCGR